MSDGTIALGPAVIAAAGRAVTAASSGRSESPPDCEPRLFALKGSRLDLVVKSILGRLDCRDRRVLIELTGLHYPVVSDEAGSGKTWGKTWGHVLKYELAIRVAGEFHISTPHPLLPCALLP